MAKKKSKEPTHCIADFDGGPRDGEELRVVIPPPPYIKLALPVWCVYVPREKTREAGGGSASRYRFEYIGVDAPEELKGQIRAL